MQTLETTLNKNYACLILTPDYQPANFLPLSVVEWQTCMKLLCLNKITPIHLYEDRFIRSARMAIQLPAVAVTKEHFKFRKGRVLFSRHLMFVRDLYTCAYCGEQFNAKELTIDHVVPKTEGGKTSWENCVSACKDCNQKKGHKYWRPTVAPFRPDYYTLAARRLQLPMSVGHESWLTYMNLGSKQSQLKISTI